MTRRVPLDGKLTSEERQFLERERRGGNADFKDARAGGGRDGWVVVRNGGEGLLGKEFQSS